MRRGPILNTYLGPTLVTPRPAKYTAPKGYSQANLSRGSPALPTALHCQPSFSLFCLWCLFFPFDLSNENQYLEVSPHAVLLFFVISTPVTDPCKPPHRCYHASYALVFVRIILFQPPIARCKRQSTSPYGATPCRETKTLRYPGVNALLTSLKSSDNASYGAPRLALFSLFPPSLPCLSPPLLV